MSKPASVTKKVEARGLVIAASIPQDAPVWSELTVSLSLTNNMTEPLQYGSSSSLQGFSFMVFDDAQHPLELTAYGKYWLAEENQLTKYSIVELPVGASIQTSERLSQYFQLARPGHLWITVAWKAGTDVRDETLHAEIEKFSFQVDHLQTADQKIGREW